MRNKIITIGFVIIAILLFGITFYNKNLKPPPPPPPKIVAEFSSQQKDITDTFLFGWLKDCNWDKGQLVRACNFNEPDVRSFALNLASNNQGNFNIGQVADVFDHIYNNWKYVDDPKTNYEYIASASNTIKANLKGDCDDFAVIMASSMIAIGGDARISYAFRKEGENTLGHAYAEVNIGKENVSEIIEYIKNRYVLAKLRGVQTKVDDSGNTWLNLDWFASTIGGKYTDFDYGTTFYLLQNFCENLK